MKGKDKTRRSVVISITVVMVVSRAVLESVEGPAHFACKKDHGQPANSLNRRYPLYLQITPSIVKYGQVNQSAATQVNPATTVNVVEHHHQIFRPRKREISRRKNRRKANFTGKITNHQTNDPAFSSFEISGIFPRMSNAKPFCRP